MVIRTSITSARTSIRFLLLCKLVCMCLWNRMISLIWTKSRFRKRRTHSRTECRIFVRFWMLRNSIEAVFRTLTLTLFSSVYRFFYIQIDLFIGRWSGESACALIAMYLIVRVRSILQIDRSRSISPTKAFLALSEPKILRFIQRVVLGEVYVVEWSKTNGKSHRFDIFDAFVVFAYVPLSSLPNTAIYLPYHQYVSPGCFLEIKASMWNMESEPMDHFQFLFGVQ